MQLFHFHDLEIQTENKLRKIQQVFVYVVSSCQYVTYLQLSFYSFNVSKYTSLFTEKKAETLISNSSFQSSLNPKSIFMLFKWNEKYTFSNGIILYTVYILFIWVQTESVFSWQHIWIAFKTWVLISSLCCSLTNITHHKILFSCWDSHNSLSCPMKAITPTL